MVVFPGEREWNDAHGWVVVQQNDSIPLFYPLLPIYLLFASYPLSSVPLYFVPSLYFLTRHSCLTKPVPHTGKQHFQWKHPSKIKINDAFRLIYCWRDCRSQEQDALIWVTTSKLFDDAHRPSRQARSLQRSPVQVESSDEERFILSRSSEIDEDEGSCHRRVHLLGFLVILPKSLI